MDSPSPEEVGFEGSTPSPGPKENIMTETKLDKVIGQIRQLRKISESTHSRAEAETTLAIAAKLIAQHQVSEAELQSDPANQGDDPIDTEKETILYESGRIVPWKSTLAVQLAKLNGLFLYNATVRGGKNHRQVSRYRIIGRRSDIAITVFMMEYLLGEIERLADAHVNRSGNAYVVDASGKLVKRRGINPQKESWCVGCVSGFISKMEAEKAEVEKTASTTAMVFIGNKAKEAEDAYKSSSGAVKLVASTKKSKAQINAENYHAGFAAGQKLSVNKGLPDK